MRCITRSLALALLIAGPNVYAADSKKELSWSAAHMEGIHLQLVSPKDKGDTVELFFGKDGNLAITSCKDGTCVAPLTIWKIENNRLKTGYAPTEGDVLVEVGAKKLTLRRPSGQLVVYEIKGRS